MFFFISEALISIRRQLLMMMITIVTIMIALLVFGMFLLVTININNMTTFLASKLEIRIYLKEGLTKKELSSFQGKIARMPNVKDVVFLHKDEAWKQFAANFKQIELKDIMKNPLPHTIKVYLTDNQNLPFLIKRVRSHTNYVDDIKYAGEIAERLQVFSRFIHLTGLALIGFLTMATLFIIVNTIRLTVIARQNEIEIMQLVGATPSFIKWPFIIEGLILGGIGSGFAIALLKYSYLFFSSKVQLYVPFFPFVFDDTILNKIYIIVGVVGTILGVMGANISVSRSLKFK